MATKLLRDVRGLGGLHGDEVVWQVQSQRVGVLRRRNRRALPLPSVQAEGWGVTTSASEWMFYARVYAAAISEHEMMRVRRCSFVVEGSIITVIGLCLRASRADNDS